MPNFFGPRPELPNPETLRAERKKIIVELAAKDLNSPDIIAYHGLSIETLEYLINQGCLPGDTVNSDPKNIGNLFFFPRETQNPIERAASVAGIIAQHHHASSKLELPIDNPDYHELLTGLWGNTFKPEDKEKFIQSDWVTGLKKIFEKTKKTEDELFDALLEAQDYRGFVVGLNKKTLTDFKKNPGDSPEDFYINCPFGLDIKYLSALRPLGKKEQEFIESLK